MKTLLAFSLALSFVTPAQALFPAYANTLFCQKERKGASCLWVLKFSTARTSDGEFVLETSNSCAGMPEFDPNKRYIWRVGKNAQELLYIYQERASEGLPFRNALEIPGSYAPGKITLVIDGKDSVYEEELCSR
jgi:hypothetical protein